MGCFDTVRVPCPACGVEELAQSKGGDCLLRTYSLSNAPVDVLSDINHHAPFVCTACGEMFHVVVKRQGSMIKVQSETYKETSDDD